MKLYSFYLSLILLVFSSLFSNSVQAQFTITESFRGQLGPDIKIGDDARLTSGVNDPVGAGWLRLTSDDQEKKGYAYINRTFPSTLGLLVDFEYKIWRTKDGRGGLNQGGDGFSIYLFDGKTTESEFRLGGYGGSLGYARNKEDKSNIAGLKNGYLGVGFDAFGNFVNKSSPAKFTGASGEIANSIGIRGRTTAADDATSNRYLKGINISGPGKGVITGLPENASVQDFPNRDGWENHIDYNRDSRGRYPTSRPSDETFYRRVQLEVTPTLDGMYQITLRWMREGETTFTELMSYTTTDVPPEILKVGFAAATGWAVNYHEIRNLMISTPGNLRVSKMTNQDVLRIVDAEEQNNITYTIEVNNDTEATLNNIEFKDILTDTEGNEITPDMFVINNISHTGFLAGTTLPTTSSTNVLTGSLNLAAKAIGRIMVSGTLKKVPVGNLLVNTVNVMPTDITDEDLENNTSIVRTPVIAENVDLTLQKQSLGNPCIDYVKGNSYELRVVNMGIESATFRRLGHNRVNRIVVYKDIPSGYSYDDSETNNSRWDKRKEEFSGGVQRYVYIAKGASTGNQTLLGNGNIYENAYPIKYTIIPPVGVSSYVDQATVEYVSVTSGADSYWNCNLK